MISGNARFAIMTLALAGAALFVQSRRQVHAPRAAVASLPLQFGGYDGSDVPFSPRTLASVGPGQFVQRTYRQETAGQPYVDLYIAYHPDRRALGSHLPDECLIGAGWSAVESGPATLSLPGNQPLVANRYLITRGADRQLVLFWFWVHGRSLATEASADFNLTLDSLRWNRNDYAVVRLNTPLAPGESANAAQQRLLAFASQLNPLLNQYISR